MKKIIGGLLTIALILSISATASSTGLPFSDVPQNAVYFEAVTGLSQLSELGYGDGTFRPEATITRAEFVALLLKILEAPDLSDGKRDQIFLDVPVSNWANRYINLAFESGLVNGNGKGMFVPEANIKYEETIKITVNCVLGGNGIGMTFPGDYIELARELGIADVQSDIGQDMKRWQAAMLIYNAVNVTDETVSAVTASRKWVAESARSSYGGAADDYDMLMEESAPMAMPGFEPSDSKYTHSAPAALGSMEDAAVMPMPIPDDGGDSDYQISAGMLTAGEWNDIASRSYWDTLMANREWSALQRRWGISTEYYTVHVADGDTPVVGARVVLSGSGGAVWSAVTDNKGNAVIFASSSADEQSNDFSLEVVTSADSITIDNVVLSDSMPYEVQIGQGDISESIDVMFMVDTTGSMSDELRYIKEELKYVISAIDSDARVSCNFYRDLGDEYIVRSFDFTTDIDEAVTQISGQRATGGGDYPEAVEIALANAVYDHDWSADAKERLLFLVLDAPPHYDAERVQALNDCIKSAAEMGIRIIPIASSGVDKDTEFLLRSMSIATNGTYVFITDHSGIGNSHIDPTIEQYEVEFLNDLLVRIINERL